MAEDDAKEVGEGAPQAAPKKSPSQKNPLVAVLLVLNMISLGVVAFMQYRFFEMESKKPDLVKLLNESGIDVPDEVKAENRPTEVVTKETLIDMATFTVNLAQGDGPRRYVRLNAVLKL